MKETKKSKNRILLYTVLISLLLHALIMLVPIQLNKEAEQEPIRVVRIDPVEIPRQQIVDETQKPLNNETPDDTRFLSKDNQKVDQETKARLTGPTKNQNIPSPELNPENQNSKPKEIDKDTMLLAIQKPQSERKTAEKRPEQKLDMSLMERSLASLNPSATDDYLPDVEDSNETLLNTKQFVYYSFYARIKEQLRMYWGQHLQKTFDQRFRTGQQALADRDLVTKLRIQLRNNGDLKNVFVVSSSGYPDIDDAAVKAFEQASPFPNPPSGMIERDGSVKLRWDFIVQANTGNQIKIFLSKQ